ncbi:putative Holliday junction resolvase [Xanthomonas sp. F1]
MPESGLPEAGAPAPASATPATIRRDGTVLGFDVGHRRIGVAVGSPFGNGARALAVIDVHAQGPDWAALDRLQAEWRPHGLVVGDPLTLDGADQPNRKRAHAFARELGARYRLPVVLVDERSSSVEAAQRFAVDRAAGRKRRRDAAALDAVAAAVIVERWLAAPDDAIPPP